MSRRDILLQIYEGEDILTADGFDEAILGIDESSMRVIYSIAKCIKILMSRDEMTEEEALEYIAYNMQGAYVGEQTPIWCADYNFIN